MSRTRRAVHSPLFLEPQGDFNEQLYLALRKSPWWMISIAFHGVLFALSTLIAPEEAMAAKTEVVQIQPGTGDTPPDRDPEKSEIEDVDPIHAEDIQATEPAINPEFEQSNHNETDNNEPTETTYGKNLGPVSASFEGPSNNRYIGIGGGGGPFGGRGPGGHHNYSTRAGSGPQTRAHDVVEDALRWLAAHQSADGGWEAEGFRSWCDGKKIGGDGPDGAGKAQHDVGVTGLSLLAFLGAGYTNRSEGPFGKVVANGLRYLKNCQDAEGAFGSRAQGHFVYDHSVAALAMVEAYGMTASTNYRNPAQKALDFIAVARNPYFAWRYGVKPGDNDTSVTGWMMMAMKSAKMVIRADEKNGRPPSLQIDDEAFDGIRSWIDKVTDENGRVGYQQRGSGPARPAELVDRFPADKSESMTAVGMLARIFLGEDPKTSDPVKKGAELCKKLLPRWDTDGSIDMYYWYYATLAMFQVGGEPWSKWEAALKTGIVDHQRHDTDFCAYKGSWDPIDPWGPEGGRVYSTATLAMCLEVWSRYEKVFGTSNEK